MNEYTEKIKGYEKLPPERQMIMDIVMKNLAEGAGVWKQGWKTVGTPKSGITGKPYRGINNLFLTLIGMTEKYSDNRWVTFNQMRERDWHFKTDEEGKSLAKNKGATVEFYELRDRETKKSFDRSVLSGMTKDEREEYIEKNVYPLRKYYRVFNGDLIDGIPAIEKTPMDEKAKSERAEKFIKFWSDKESTIVYGGSESFYRPKTDEIHLPKREDFHSSEDYYSTALHEIGHSTGHEKRLNRTLLNKFGSTEYAAEELRAEIASLFMEQDFEIQADENSVRNNSAYIKEWMKEITEDPDALFKAIIDADKISKYVLTKEKDHGNEAAYYAIATDENEYGETVYKAYMSSAYGQTALAINYAFTDKDELKTEFEKFQSAPAWSDTEFREVTMDELEQISREQAEREQVAEEASEEYIKPSEAAAKTIAVGKAVDMTERGAESLTRMSDREVVDKAEKVRSGDTFERLYKGEKVFASETKNEEILLMRMAMFSEDKEQLMRVFRSSGQFQDDEPNSYYMKLAEKAMETMSGQRASMASETLPSAKRVKISFGGNAKV